MIKLLSHCIVVFVEGVSVIPLVIVFSMTTVVVFQEKFGGGGAETLNLLNVLEVAEFLSSRRVLYNAKCTLQLRLWQKCGLFMEKVYLAFGQLLLPRI